MAAEKEKKGGRRKRRKGGGNVTAEKRKSGRKNGEIRGCVTGSIMKSLGVNYFKSVDGWFAFHAEIVETFSFRVSE